MSQERFGIHQHLTDRMVAAIEAGAGQWQMPWHRGSGCRHPVNIASGNKYRGVNILGLWVEAQVNGFGSDPWDTFRQWADKPPFARDRRPLTSFSTRRLRSMPSETTKMNGV
jgi:antirestriction protein ArdC